MSKIINDAETVVIESLRGLQHAHASILQVNESPLFVRTAGKRPGGHVGVISGGGSGHEPLHAGFVGLGMLAAAVPGPVFTSPGPNQITAAARSVDSGAGVLFLVKNYTGDIMNFEAAAEDLAAEGIRSATVVIRDDVAIADTEATAGRRGVAGVVFVEKMAGAAAARGNSLDLVAAVAQAAADRVRTIGVALAAGSLFHSPEPTFDLTEGELEVGIGIHGEPGRWRGPLVPSRELVETMLDAVLAEIDDNKQVLVLVNGMGSTSLAELHIVFNDAYEILEHRGFEVRDALVGDFVTSVDMAGFSISILGVTPELEDFWRDPVDTPALSRHRR
ncbi:dihydroxyacetone kinase subunit DhaK [Kribbella kalugense]|uniref:Dihydroxyacetone kinase-like protein n=1 Tax=Kribbella kalugense TaxID=2512221 RepID=A0A4R8A3S9_9ACTN|nr:dihydroxyacetone kinase subunit DhaK [Kribbella kalugense]TDW24301.1 dihydroxyacetone kinase-like protein [Kribbella kalugense]